MIAGTLEVQMSANLARLASDMQQAKTMVGGAMNSIESSVRFAKQALGALGVGLSINYFVGMVKGSIDAQERLHDLSLTTRLTVEDLAGLKFASKTAGGDIEGIAMSLNRLAQNMGKDPEKFQKLGISAKGPLEAFKQLSDILNLLESTEQRNAVAAGALGKQWQSAAPLLAEGSARIQELIDKGKNLSGMTTQMAKEADEMKDKYEEAATSFEASKNKLVFGMMPALTDIIRLTAAAAKEGGLLAASWTAVGGAVAMFLGDTDSQFVAKRLKEIEMQLSQARAQLVSKSLRPEGSTSSFFDFIIPDVRLGERELAKIREVVAQLERERKRLMPAEKMPKALADPVAMKEAAERAALFLKKQTEIEAEQKLFITSQQHLEKQFFALRNEGQLTITMYETMHGSLMKLTPAHKAVLLEKAKEIDTYRREVEVRKMLVIGFEAEFAARDKVMKITRDVALANRQEVEELQFLHSMLGVSAREQEQLNAARAIELKLRQDISDLPVDEEGGLLPGGEEAIIRLHALAEAQKRAVRELIAERQKAEREWTMGARRFFNDYEDMATHSANMTYDLFNDAFRGMEDAFVSFIRTGKVNWSSFADMILNDLVRIAVRQTITGPAAKALNNFDWSSIFGGGGANAGGPTSSAMMTGGTFAEGGTMRPNTFNMVGEEGPEIVWSGTHGGTVIPNGAINGAGARSINVYPDLRGASPEAVKELHRMIQALDASIESRAVSGVANASRRGRTFT